jgi:hypothetical protein
MGTVLTYVILAILFGGIIYYLIRSIKTKGTTCTSCTSCVLVDKCNKDTVKKDMMNYYKQKRV